MADDESVRQAVAATIDAFGGLDVAFNAAGIDGEAGKLLAESSLENWHRVLEAGYQRIGGRLNAFPDSAIPVILYTEQRLQDVTRSPQWAGGLYDGRIRLAVGGG